MRDVSPRNQLVQHDPSSLKKKTTIKIDKYRDNYVSLYADTTQINLLLNYVNEHDWFALNGPLSISPATHFQ